MRVEPRFPLSKDRAYSAYCRAVQTLEPHHGSKVHGIREHVRHLRAECARMRVRAQQAERELERLRGTGHE